MFGSFLPKVALAKYDRQAELELLKQYQTTNDIKALKKLKISFRPLVRKVILQQKPNNDDISISQLALRIDGEMPRLFKNHDPSKGELNTYLTNQVQYLVQNAVKENILGPHVPRPEQDGLYVFKQGLNQASLEFGSNPTPKQILKFAPSLGSLDEVERIKQYHTETLIGDAKHGNEDSGFVAFKDQFMTTSVDEGDRLRSLHMDEIKRLLNELDPQDKAIINQYVFNGKSMADIALSLGLSSAYVRKVINQWKEKTKSKGIDSP